MLLDAGYHFDEDSKVSRDMVGDLLGNITLHLRTLRKIVTSKNASYHLYLT